MSKAPKPSVLLGRALKLFGPNGERWIKSDEKIEPGTTHAHPATGEDTIYKHGAYCSMGALNEIDTVNEDEAVHFLKTAMALDGDKDTDFERRFIDVEEINDNDDTKWKDIQRWFTRAQILAKSVGR